MLPFVPGLITSGDFMREYTATVEDCGVESVWAVEHVVVAADYEPKYPYSADGRMPSGASAGAVPMSDPLELLSFVAAASRHVNLGTCVVVAPLHSPAVLAKRVATVDTLSGGRMLLGLGIGWQKEEYAAVGAPFRDRGERLEECIGAMRALWADSPASFAGKHWSFERVYSSPQPERGAVPILLGGNSTAAVERAGRLADGWFPFTIAPDELAESAARLRAVARSAGRDPDAIEISAWPGSHDPATEYDVDAVRRYVDAGARRLLLRSAITRPDELPVLRQQLERYQNDVLAKL
jgi:probable F420-dependent oxidoreductase